MDLAEFRKEYSARGLRREELNPNPIAQFSEWFGQATELGVHEPNALTLATVDETGMPFQRTVLLKYYDPNGFVFFTNYSSRKSAQIASNPKVSLLLPWITLERQVIVQGTAQKISTAESLKYFASRPRESQIGAWVSNQSEVITSRKFLMQKLTEVRENSSRAKSRYHRSGAATASCPRPSSSGKVAPPAYTTASSTAGKTTTGTSSDCHHNGSSSAARDANKHRNPCDTEV